MYFLHLEASSFGSKTPCYIPSSSPPPLSPPPHSQTSAYTKAPWITTASQKTPP
ncbi:hypothetical protein M441DRAFT_62347 [Trichoderma asperellum CBS 433.97]|uniref:Uncharacterized protein n=1 Tax=Trichoderma asperellum (strain ATCC 204424 / CBS 433.97 / NBRC 101777) TaxID=1042311 RepID=A0A2T3YTV1_TRIA4|nr:hypothetical protein M441DRAFT_62347 [Trichoderma asperellum CBS 433.97]PTB35967.1 hypothetical protein M441DRAFT_62347 [Trichoderma asperellum CBS 433.97]